MFPARRRTLFCVTLVSLSLMIMLLLTPNWSPPGRPARLSRQQDRMQQTRHTTVTGRGSSRGGGGNSNAGGRVGTGGGRVQCPTGRFVSISASGRLGNKLCEYATLWALQLDDRRARPAWVLPVMQRALSPLVHGLKLPTLPDSCVKNARFRNIKYRYFNQAATLNSRQPVLITDYPCDLSRFHKHRDTILQQLALRDTARLEAQRRLRQYTAPICGGGGCTYIGVHVRRTDYGAAVKRMYNGTLVGERYLRRALELCRRRYRRPAFVVSSDDLPWVRRRLRGPDLVIAGSSGAGSAGRDLALLAQCNHTVMTHGTFGFWAAYLARGDVIVPTGFGARDSYLSVSMRKTGLNVTVVPAF